MLSTVLGDGSIWASSIPRFISRNSWQSVCNSLSQTSALSISFVSSSVVSRYKYLIRSVCVKVFIIGSVFDHLLAQVDQRIPHSSQCRIDAHACAIGNLLK